MIGVQSRNQESYHQKKRCNLSKTLKNMASFYRQDRSFSSATIVSHRWYGICAHMVVSLPHPLPHTLPVGKQTHDHFLTWIWLLHGQWISKQWNPLTWQILHFLSSSGVALLKGLTFQRQVLICFSLSPVFTYPILSPSSKSCCFFSRNTTLKQT